MTTETEITTDTEELVVPDCACEGIVGSDPCPKVAEFWVRGHQPCAVGVALLCQDHLDYAIEYGQDMIEDPSRKCTHCHRPYRDIEKILFYGRIKG